MSEIVKYKSVEFEYFENELKNLFIFFPQAGNILPNSVFFNELSKVGSVIMLTGGYFGISSNLKKSNLEDLTFGKATKAISEVVRNINKNKVVIGASVGALHALDLNVKLSNVNKTVLISPAFYKKSWPRNNIVDNLFRKAFLEEDFFETKTFKSLKHIPGMSSVYTQMVRIKNEIGTRSYLECLGDVRRFDYKNYLKVIDNSLIMVGNNDLFFKYLCDKKVVNKSRTVFLNRGHTPHIENPKEVFQIIFDFIN